jgi:dihydroorotase
MKMIIQQGRIIDPSQQLDQVTNIYISHGHIVAVGDQIPTGFEPSDEVETLDAQGLWVLPGLVDLQARLGEPGKHLAGTIASETKAAVAGGITTLCCPPDTQPVTDTQAVTELIQRRARQAATAFVLPLGALTKDLAGEQLSNMNSLKAGGCVALSQANQPIQNPLVLKNALNYAASQDLLVMLRCENQQLKNHGVAHSGAVSTRLGLNPIPRSAETIALARDLILVAESGVRAHFSQLSCAESVQMIAQAKAQGLPVTCDVAAHQLHLTEMDLLEFSSLFHVCPPLRSQDDQLALIAGVADGTIDAIVSDHTPLNKDHKLLPFGESTPGISALETLLPLTLKLVSQGQLSLERAISTLTWQPANIINVMAGRLSSGYSADLCLVDPEAFWAFDPAQLISAGKNSPFAGWRFESVVVTTLFQGRTVYQNRAV